MLGCAVLCCAGRGVRVIEGLGVGVGVVVVF